MYKVTNIMNDIRRIETGGITFDLLPNESRIIKNPINISEKVFKIELIENRPKKVEEKSKKKNKKGDDK